MIEVKIYKDGNQFCSLIGKNLQEGVTAFGKSPIGSLEALVEKIRKNDVSGKEIEYLSSLNMYEFLES